MADPENGSWHSAPPNEDNDIPGQRVPITVRAVGRPEDNEVDERLKSENLKSAVGVLRKQLVRYGLQSAQMEEPYRPEQTPDAMKMGPADAQRRQRHGRVLGPASFQMTREIFFSNCYEGVQNSFFVEAQRCAPFTKSQLS